MQRQNSIILFLLIFFFTLTFFLCYYQTFLWLHYKYSLKDSYYSHGYFIPLVSAYIVYCQKERLKHIPIKKDRNGLMIVILSLFLHLGAVMSDINFLSAFSFYFYILGTTLYLLGKPFTRALLFPLVFLFFMCPIPNIIIDMVGLPSKYFATFIGLKVVGLFNISFYQEGFRIYLKDVTLTVGTPCNGMRTLIAFSALGFLCLYMVKIKRWKQCLFLIGMYPLTILLNGFRVAALILIAHTFGIEKASPSHINHNIAGILIFLIGFFLLLGSLRVLKNFEVGK